jgi:GNAT superfamily N-acetyltransferase
LIHKGEKPMKEKLLATRPASDSDFDFAWKVYCKSVKPLIEPKLSRAWVDDDERERFRFLWDPAVAQVITIDDEPVGWGAATVTEEKVVIDHLYFLEEHRGKGYGTRLLSELIQLWKGQGKAVHASVLKENRALSLAARLGFEKLQDDDLARNLVCRP